MEESQIAVVPLYFHKSINDSMTMRTQPILGSIIPQNTHSSMPIEHPTFAIPPCLPPSSNEEGKRWFSNKQARNATSSASATHVQIFVDANVQRRTFKNRLEQIGINWS